MILFDQGKRLKRLSTEERSFFSKLLQLLLKLNEEKLKRGRRKVKKMIINCDYLWRSNEGLRP